MHELNSLIRGRTHRRRLSNKDERKKEIQKRVKQGNQDRTNWQDGGREQCTNARVRQVGSASSPFRFGFKRSRVPFQNRFGVVMSVKGGQSWVERVRGKSDRRNNFLMS